MLLVSAALLAPSLYTAYNATGACDARSLITQHEGKRACVYTDSQGHPTVGIGYNLDNSGARQAIAAVGADYDKVRAGTQCLSDDQIMKLFEPAYQGAVSEAQRVVSSFDSLCCNVQEVMTDMTYNLGSLSSFTQFVGFINQGQWQQAADDGRHTEWCSQVGNRCTDDMGRVQNGCSGPGPGPSPPGPSPTSCCSCIEGGGGQACASSCASRGSKCQACVQGGGGKACASNPCGCGGPGPGPGPGPSPSPSSNQQWYGPNSQTKQTILFKGNTAKCVDLPNSDQTNGNKIQIWDCNNNKNQQWWFDGEYIRSGLNDKKCFDVPNGDFSNGKKLEIWDCNGHSNQQFKGGGTYQWESVAQPGKCIDLYGGDTTNGKLLEIWDCVAQ